VGRTIFSDPLHRWAARETTSKGAATEIGRSYREFVNIFEQDQRADSGSSQSLLPDEQTSV